MGRVVVMCLPGAESRGRREGNGISLRVAHLGRSGESRAT